MSRNSSSIRDLNRIKNPKLRVLAWVGAGVAACLLGTWAWLLAIIFAILGAVVINIMGWTVPSWTPWLALLGLPLGAYLELYLAGK